MLSRHDFKNSDRWLANAFMLLEHFLGAGTVNRTFGETKVRLEQRIVAALSKKTTGTLYPVDRRVGLTPREFRSQYLARSLPVILVGAAKDWECTKKWNFDFFETHYGSEKTYVARHEGLFMKEREDFDGFSTFGELIENVKTNGRQYLRFNTIVDKYPELRDDLDEVFLERHRRTLVGAGTQFFLGAKGSITPFHCAPTDNLFVMVKGRKKWFLYPPCYTAIFKPPATREGYIYSEVDARTPDDERFPGFRFLDGYEVYLEEGDILYNPPYMWHWVENLTDTIGVGYRFPRLGAAFRASATLTTMRLLATDPSLLTTLRLLLNPEQDDTKAGHLVVRYWSGFRRKRLRRQRRSRPRAA